MTDDESGNADQQRIHDLLAAQPRPTMPPQVQERILAALAAEPMPTEVPARTGRRWWPVAAAAAVLLLAGIVAVPALRPTPSAETAATGPSAPEAVATGAPAPQTDTAALIPDCSDGTAAYETGTRYQEASLQQQAQALLPAADRCPPQPAEGKGYATSADGRQGPTMRCIVHVADQAQVLVVDQGFYEDRPAVLAVVTPPQRALVVDCEKHPAQVLESVALE